MLTRLAARCCILTVVLFVFISNAVCADHYIIPDRQARSSIPSMATNDRLKVAVDPGSSYCCELISAAASSVFFTSNTIQILSYSDVAGNVTGRPAGSDSPRLGDSWARMCFVVPSTVAYPSAFLTVGTYGVLTDVQAYCNETTLYGGFNTSVTDFNFLEITNTLETVTTPLSGRTITLTLSAINTVPEPDATVINSDSFTVAAGSRYDVNIHERAGSGAFGPIKLAHNGAPGSIKAIVSQYNIVTVTPFDFAPVAQEVLRVRSELSGPNK